MEYNRYGKFWARDYSAAWFGMGVYLLVVIINLKDAPFYLLVWPIVLSLYTAWSVYDPNRERFLIIGNTIITKKGKKKQEIIIPYEATLIVSYADIGTLLSKRLDAPNEKYPLKNRYAVSILQKMELADVLTHLHGKYATKYSNESIEASFYSWHFCYSFVCNQELLDKLLQNRQCLLIIPESLKEKVTFSSKIENVYIDKGY